MKKIIYISLLTVSLLSFPLITLAQAKQTDKPISQSAKSSNSPTPQGNQVQNQIQTQNEGEDTQLNVNTQENLEANEESQGRSDTARQNMSIVAQKVEELLEEKEDGEGIGQQVRQVAQAQNQAQSQINAQLEKLESRQGFMKKLFGADQKAIKNLKQQMEQNQLRIEALQQLQTEVANQADEDQIQELTQALIDQNTSLEEQIQAEEEVGSLFGWLIKLFNK